MSVKAVGGYGGVKLVFGVRTVTIDYTKANCDLGHRVDKWEKRTKNGKLIQIIKGYIPQIPVLVENVTTGDYANVQAIIGMVVSSLREDLPITLYPNYNPLAVNNQSYEVKFTGDIIELIKYSRASEAQHITFDFEIEQSMSWIPTAINELTLENIYLWARVTGDDKKIITKDDKILVKR